MEWTKSRVVEFRKLVGIFESVVIVRFVTVIKSRMKVWAESAIAVSWIKSMMKERLVSVTVEAVMFIRIGTAIMAIMAC